VPPPVASPTSQEEQPTEPEVPTPTQPNVTPEPAPVPPSAVASTSAPTTPSPTLSPTHSGAYKLADGLVYRALQYCPGMQNFDDSATPQGQIFQKIVNEVVEQTVTDPGGFIIYPLDFGYDYLREKYALEMLYQATNGGEWIDNNLWSTESDPCTGWNGITNCTTRREGSCGITHINLSKCPYFVSDGTGAFMFGWIS
jgi:hypothetical protein